MYYHATNIAGIKELLPSVSMHDKPLGEQNRCAMACQGCGAVFIFFQKKAVDSSLKSIYC